MGNGLLKEKIKMEKEKQIELEKELNEIFDEEYKKRGLLTASNTAEKLIAKGYRKESEVAREFANIILAHYPHTQSIHNTIEKELAKFINRSEGENNGSVI